MFMDVSTFRYVQAGMNIQMEQLDEGQVIIQGNYRKAEFNGDAQFRKIVQNISQPNIGPSFYKIH